MPREFVWRAPVWQADLDAFAELRNASLVRLLQETATRASSDAGFDAAYYDGTDTMWLIRRTTLTLDAPVRYGDTLHVRTWIADFRRVRSQREYEVRAGERLVARASSDWVYVDRPLGRPRRIPAEWEHAFEVAPGTANVRTAFPEVDPPSVAVTVRRRVEAHDLDALAHVNNARYVSFVEQAALDVLTAEGWSLAAQRAASGRLRATFHDLEYLDAAYEGELLGVTTWATSVDSESVERHTLIHRGDPSRLLLQARSRYRWMTTEQRAAPMPAGLYTVLTPT